MKKRFSIGEFLSSQELLNIAEKKKSGEHGQCGALFIALHSRQLKVTFAV
jgi:hypothetical protein